MTLVIVLTILVMCLTAYYCYSSTTPRWVKLVVLPLLVIYSTICYGFYEQNIGKAIPHPPVANFTYIQHKQQGNLTILTAYIDGKGLRLFVFPATQEEQEGLQQIKNRSDKGIEQQGRFNRNNNNENAGELEHWDRELSQK